VTSERTDDDATQPTGDGATQPTGDGATRQTGGLAIGRLTVDDLPLVEPLWRSLLDHIRTRENVVPIVAHEESWPRRRRDYEELLADGESFAQGAWRDTTLVGYAMVHVAAPDPVWSTGNHYVELASLSVAPDERARGVGTALLEAVERELSARGIRGYVIGVDWVNDEARRFYERRGFRVGYHLMYGLIDKAGGAAARGAGAPRQRRAANADATGLAGRGQGRESPETAAHGEG
jgi:ribosomal protein S18 acetylase RimI-like enzyme